MAGTVGPYSANHIDGIGTTSAFRNPNGLLLTNTRILYVVDASNNAIRKITFTGIPFIYGLVLECVTFFKMSFADPCPSNSSYLSPFSSTCITTPAGFYKPMFHLWSGIYACPAGYYSPVSGAIACIPCPSNSFSYPGATVCRSCPLGTYTTPSSCIIIPAGEILL